LSAMSETISAQHDLNSMWRSPFLEDDVDVKLLLATAIKFADLGHSLKSFRLHEEWSMRISREFWRLGDREKELGVPISPLCDRQADQNIAKSQVGFFQFICIPFFSMVADLVDPDMPPYLQLQENFRQWQKLLEDEKYGSFQLSKKERKERSSAAAPTNVAPSPAGADAPTPAAGPAVAVSIEESVEEN